MQELGCHTMNKLQQATASLEAQRDAGLMPEQNATPEGGRPSDFALHTFRRLGAGTGRSGLLVVVRSAGSQTS